MVGLPLSSLIKSFGELIPQDISFAISDEKRFIYYKPSKTVDLKIKPGDSIHERTVTYKALNARKKLSKRVASSVFGVPYFGTSVPIMDADHPRGCITTILPVQKTISLADYLTVRLEDRWKPVTLTNISFLEARDRKTWVYFDDTVGTNKFTLTELEFFLPDDTFIRCHRSYIVNVNQIAEIQADYHSTFLLVMKDQSRVPVSQTYARQFRQKLGF